MKRTRAKSLALGFGLSITAAQTAAYAQDASLMSCNELWYARNQIYAAEGFCFSTPRAQAAFGMGCFPPYGRLSPIEKRRVDILQAWELRRGCPL